MKPDDGTWQRIQSAILFLCVTLPYISVLCLKVYAFNYSTFIQSHLHALALLYKML